jgi:hypothetical protein
MHKLVYKKKKFGPKSLGREIRVGDGLVVIVGCDIGN